MGGGEPNRGIGQIFIVTQTKSFPPPSPIQIMTSCIKFRDLISFIFPESHTKEGHFNLLVHNLKEINQIREELNYEKFKFIRKFQVLLGSEF